MDVAFPDILQRVIMTMFNVESDEVIFSNTMYHNNKLQYSFYFGRHSRLCTRKNHLVRIAIAVADA